VALLQSFDFRFLNGDHHLQRIGVDLTGDRILVRFRDQDGNDPFAAGPRHGPRRSHLAA
jgi:hypothetical protein